MKCTDCSKRLKCRALCKYQESYVNQDNVNANYALLGDNDNFIPAQKWPDFYASNKAIVRMYFREFKTGLEIAKKLKVSHQYVYQVTNHFKRILEEKTTKNALSTPYI